MEVKIHCDNLQQLQVIAIDCKFNRSVIILTSMQRLNQTKPNSIVIWIGFGLTLRQPKCKQLLQVDLHLRCYNTTNLI